VANISICRTLCSRFQQLGRLVGLGGALIAATPAWSQTEGAKRIVSVGGAVTEILYQVGAQDRIAAIDTTSLFPPDALKTKPNVGYLRALSPEGVLSMSPDLIIMEADAGPPDAVALLDKAGIPVVHVPSGHELGELPRKIRDVAAAVGKKDDGDRIATKVETDLAKLKQDLAAVTKRKRVLFILSLTDGRPMAAGTHTAANAIIELAGAENVFAEAKGYKTISPEAAAALQPDVILMITRSSAPQEGVDILKQPAFAETPAGKTGGFIKMESLYLLGFGPRTAEAARDLASRLYPDLKLASAK
jgi:iron complex transport system substrate-binding protein